MPIDEQLIKDFYFYYFDYDTQQSILLEALDPDYNSNVIEHNPNERPYDETNPEHSEQSNSLAVVQHSPVWHAEYERDGNGNR